ncbi:MAG: MmgE/PrpD family protein [Liquorilactobacillus ghanensis]
MKNLESESVSNTERIVEKLLLKRTKNDEKLLLEARRALINYLTVLSKGAEKAEVKKLFVFFKVDKASLPLTCEDNISATRAATLNGFAAHYLDLDDTQADLRGHPSAVIMSALFAVTDTKDTMDNFFWSFVQGVELAGKFGKLLNPTLALRGWHTTGVIGTIAAAAAIGVYKQFDENELINILSFAATQSSGLEVQSGSDGKPFNAGMAARNAVEAFLFTKIGLEANHDPFSNNRGWFKTIQKIQIDSQNIVNNWLNPAEIEEPGLWFKTHPFCSAGMSSLDAAKELYKSGVRMKNCQKVIIHFPLGGDHALRYRSPQNGKEGKFSAEYIIWQVLSFGDVKDKYFEFPKVPESFKLANILFTRENDLKNDEIEARPTKIEVILKNNSIISKTIIFPQGSPKNRKSTNELQINLRQQIKSTSLIKNRLLPYVFKAINK